MKFVLVLFATLALAFAAEQYTTKYDNIDVDTILGNSRLLKIYIKCLLETGKCNDEGQTLKDVVPDALVTACKKCSEKQRASIEKVIRHLIQNNRKDWDALVAKYDPQGTHRQNYKQYYDQVQH